MYAVKGLGRDHAKFSPVATAFYRLLPAITIKRPIRGEAASRLQGCFSPGVIGLESGSDGQKVAKVEEARLDSCSRNLYRHEDLKLAVDIEKVLLIEMNIFCTATTLPIAIAKTQTHDGIPGERSLYLYCGICWSPSTWHPCWHGQYSLVVTILNISLTKSKFLRKS